MKRHCGFRSILHNKKLETILSTMGGSQSTHEVVIDNPSGIYISSDVDRRIQGLTEKRHTNGKMTKEQIEAVRHQFEEEYKQRVTDKTLQNYVVQADEFARAVQEVEAKFLRQSGGPICQDLQQEVYQCYQTHRKEPLKCSTQVRAFTDAVERARRNAIMTKQS